MNTLSLGSKSPSRRMLLDDAKIPYSVIEQNADETLCDWNQSLQQVVESIACYKMEQARIAPGTIENEYCFVLTADTLSHDANGQISGKPRDHADAIEKLKLARNGMKTGTAFCLEKKIWHDKKWHTERRILKYAQADYEFLVPDHWIEVYLKNANTLGTQAIAIESFGAQFLKTVKGSYTAIVGLPMFELREALQELEFF